jgi:hypothetical protein
MNAPTIVGAERVDVHADIGDLLPNGDDREPAVLLAALEEIGPQSGTVELVGEVEPRRAAVEVEDGHVVAMGGSDDGEVGPKHRGGDEGGRRKEEEQFIYVVGEMCGSYVKEISS